MRRRCESGVRRRRWRRVAGAALALLFAVAGVAAWQAPYYSGKYAASAEFAPLGEPRPLELHRQTEGHTCGLRALESIYEAYGLDPERARLRFRLGTDRSALPGVDEWRGTLHPDLFRVVSQDGFVVEAVDLEAPETASRLVEHLRAQTALALIVLPGGGLHWVAIGAGGGGRLSIVDSLKREPQEVDGSDFVDERLVSLLLLAPGAGADALGDLHAAGLREMLRVRERLE